MTSPYRPDPPPMPQVRAYMLWDSFLDGLAICAKSAAETLFVFVAGIAFVGVAVALGPIMLLGLGPACAIDAGRKAKRLKPMFEDDVRIFAGFTSVIGSLVWLVVLLSQ